MKSEELIELYKGLLDEGPQFIEDAIRKKDFDCAALNIRQSFLNSLKLGLIHWRLGRNPGNYFEKALQSTLKGRETLLGLGASLDVVQSLPLYNSVYVASLLEMPHPILELKDYSGGLIPTAFIGNVLMGADSIENWPKHQDSLPKKKRTLLARTTNDLYAGLLAGTISPEEGVKMGEKYYIRRKTDPFFMDGDSVHGGTHLNDRFVDFRLAAVLKKIGSTVPTVHAWRW